MRARLRPLPVPSTSLCRWLQRCTGLLLKLSLNALKHLAGRETFPLGLGGGFCVWQVASERRLNRQRTYQPRRHLWADVSLDALLWIPSPENRCLLTLKNPHRVPSGPITITSNPPLQRRSLPAQLELPQERGEQTNAASKIGRIHNVIRLVPKLAARRCRPRSHLCRLPVGTLCPERSKTGKRGSPLPPSDFCPSGPTRYHAVDSNDWR